MREGSVAIPAPGVAHALSTSAPTQSGRKVTSLCTQRNARYSECGCGSVGVANGLCTNSDVPLQQFSQFICHRFEGELLIDPSIRPPQVAHQHHTTAFFQNMLYAGKSGNYPVCKWEGERQSLVPAAHGGKVPPLVAGYRLPIQGHVEINSVHKVLRSLA